MIDLLSRLKAGRSSLGVVTLGDVKIGLRILTEQDYLEAQIATDVAMREAGLELGLSTADAFESEKASQLLARALVDIDSGNLLVSSAKGLREAISRDQKSILIEAYLAHEKKFSPSERTMNDEEFSALLDEVKKTPQTVHSSDLNTGTLKRLITALASQPTS